MPILTAAKKSVRADARKRVFNDRRRRTMRTSVKAFEKLVSEDKTDEAKSMLPEVYKAIDKATKAGILKKNTASRKKSRLSKLLEK